MIALPARNRVFSESIAADEPSSGSALREEHGATMIEFAMILPILALVIFSALEVARLYRIVQVSTLIGRQVVSWAARSCADFDEGTAAQTSARTVACLQGVLYGSNGQKGLRSVAEALFPGSDFSIVVTIYRRNNGSATTASSLSRLAIFGEEPSRGRVSRFSIDGLGLKGPVSLSSSYTTVHPRIVLVEVFFPFVPSVRGVPLLGKFDYYDATVL